ncbi:MAG: hypothetical protein IAG13_36525, partial [Deltaproteobacteria bacterium]|nr:hypothetical protein [Nannocystaceae bacterium]
MRLAIGRTLARIAVAAWLVAPASACAPKGMKKIEVPAAGLRIAYDLDPGATYVGRLRIGNTRTIEREGVVAGNLSQALECDVELKVLGADAQRGGILVQVSFDAIELDWNLPATSGISSTEFTRDVALRLQGMNVSFNLLPTGEIVYMPVPPAELSGELAYLVDQVLRGVEDAFVVVPLRPVRVG